MAHRNILDGSKTALVVIDVQAGFRPIISEFAKTAANIAIAVQGFAQLGVPILVTEQYPKGLGHTVNEIASVLPETAKVIEKTSFSSCGSAPFVENFSGVEQVVVCGLETHICVSQTAH